ncbi:hypothetical protein [Streptomyces sp. NBC_01262]|uniref:hypothetical protein n=1 Tax=Streptomyces sp. NBC_01262 TaxID=2903803 RepID=UPI002E35E488|nr:hypothetical protein [Streptomyces sp. NBC_01262]
MDLATTADDVENLFATKGRAKTELATWKSKRPRHVVNRVMKHVSVTPYKVRSEQFESFVPGHPLEHITPEEAYRVEQIRDWFPDFAMVHLFHFLLELKGDLFTFEEFRMFCKNDPAGLQFNHQSQDKIRELVERETWDPQMARRSMMWRVGNGYYSFLRELYLVSRLREAKLDARIHPLADALFRVDAWCDRATIEMFISSKQFKQGKDGRKRTPSYYLEDQPGFGYLRLEMESQHKWGVLHLPTHQEIEGCITEVRSWLRKNHIPSANQ